MRFCTTHWHPDDDPGCAKVMATLASSVEANTSMEIREATIADTENIRDLYLQAFDAAEAEKVASLALKLLAEHQAVKTISLVATKQDAIVGHVAFSPVFFVNNRQHLGYILAPLAVAPDRQKQGIGALLVRHGLAILTDAGASIVFVYGDPRYYSRFGFSPELAQDFIAPYPLQFPEGWQALHLDPTAVSASGKIQTVESLNDPDLW